MRLPDAAHTSSDLAILVKPRGLFGDAYMAAIRPFRHLIVYPDLLRRIERVWRAGSGEAQILV